MINRRKLFVASLLIGSSLAAGFFIIHRWLDPQAQNLPAKGTAKGSAKGTAKEVVDPKQTVLTLSQKTPDQATTTAATHPQSNQPQPRESEADAGEVFRRLSASTQAHDNYRAYKMLSGCAMQQTINAAVAGLPRDEIGKAAFQANEAKRQSSQSQCKSLPYASASQRSALLEVAVNAGIKGAVIDYYVEGPGGNAMDLVNRPEDLLVKQWFTKATGLLATSAGNGDFEAAYTLSQIYSMGPAGVQDNYLAALYETLGFELMKKQSLLTSQQEERRRGLVGQHRKSLTDGQIAQIDKKVNTVLKHLNP